MVSSVKQATRELARLRNVNQLEEDDEDACEFSVATVEAKQRRERRNAATFRKERRAA